MNLLKPTVDQLSAPHLDITEPGMEVEIRVSDKGVLWVNVGPVCVLRICRTSGVILHDDRARVFPKEVKEMTQEEFDHATDPSRPGYWHMTAPCCRRQDIENGWCNSCGKGSVL